MKSKIKIVLFIAILLSLLSNIPIMMGATEYARYVVNSHHFLFGNDATFLLVMTHIHSGGLNYTPEILDPNWLVPAMRFREITLILSFVISIWLFCIEWCLNSERKAKHIFKYIIYILITFFGAVVINNLSLENTSPGIYDFFRRVKVSYIFAITEPPWLYYYLVMLLPIFIILILVGIDLIKNDQNHHHNFK